MAFERVAGRDRNPRGVLQAGMEQPLSAIDSPL
jgi:hypothetical protein